MSTSEFARYARLYSPREKAAALAYLMLRVRPIADTLCLIPVAVTDPEERFYVTVPGMGRMTISRAMAAITYDLDPSFQEWQAGHLHAICFKSCCNPLHIEPQTPKQQAIFRELHGRTARGEANGAATRSKEIARTVWLFANNPGRRRGDITRFAELLGERPDFIAAVASGRRWAQAALPSVGDLAPRPDPDPRTGLNELDEVVAHQLVRIHGFYVREIAQFFAVTEPQARGALAFHDGGWVPDNELAALMGTSSDTARKARRWLDFPNKHLFVHEDEAVKAHSLTEVVEWAIANLPLPIGRRPKAPSPPR